MTIVLQKAVESTDWKSDRYILLPSFLQLSPYWRIWPIFWAYLGTHRTWALVVCGF